MKQSLELMRRRHAYYTKLITEHDIHTPREFYDKLNELFSMFGVEVSLNEDGTGRIAINGEDYDYEDYTILDGVEGGLATISNIVEWKPVCSYEEINIFRIEEYSPYNQVFRNR